MQVRINRTSALSEDLLMNMRSVILIACSFVISFGCRSPHSVEEVAPPSSPHASTMLDYPYRHDSVTNGQNLMYLNWDTSDNSLRGDNYVREGLWLTLYMSKGRLLNSQRRCQIDILISCLEDGSSVHYSDDCELLASSPLGEYHCEYRDPLLSPHGYRVNAGKEYRVYVSVSTAVGEFRFKPYKFIVMGHGLE